MNKLNYLSVPLIIILLITNIFFFSKVNNIEKDKEALSSNIKTLNEEKITLEENYQKSIEEIDNLKGQTQNSVLEENLTPEETVKKFIEADMFGARIGGKVAGNTQDIKKYISFTYEGDQAMVIKSYEITSSETDNNKAKAMVKYTCAGGGYKFDSVGAPTGVKSCDSYFKETSEYSSQAGKIGITVDRKNNIEIINFNLEKINNQWKVSSPPVPPHISIKTFLNHTKTLLKNPADIDKFNKFFTE